MVKRCFILGNGPSLNKVDLTLLKNEITFGCNKIYLNYDKMGYAVYTYFIIDRNDFLCYGTSGMVRDYLKKPENIKVFITADADAFFVGVPEIRVKTTGNYAPPFTEHYDPICTSVVMIAEAMKQGYKEIYLIGVDLYYDMSLFSHTSDRNDVKLVKPDTSHFTEHYWDDMTFNVATDQNNRLIQCHTRLADYIKIIGVRVFNAGVGGCADMFPRVDYYSLFKQKQRR